MGHYYLDTQYLSITLNQTEQVSWPKEIPWILTLYLDNPYGRSVPRVYDVFCCKVVAMVVFDPYNSLTLVNWPEKKTFFWLNIDKQESKWMFYLDVKFYAWMIYFIIEILSYSFYI